MATIFVKNADRMLTQVNLTDDGIQFTFADGARGRIPLSELPGNITASDITDIQLPNPYLIVVRSPGEREIEIPWDFARGHSDPLYRPRVEAVALAGRQALGSRIKQLRESCGLTQEALARLAGISRVTLVRIENSAYSPRFETLIALAQALHKPIDQLLTGSDLPS